MEARSQREIQDQAEQNRHQLLQAEAAALLLLRRQRDVAVRKGLRRGYSLHRIATEVGLAVRAAVADLRTASRATGVHRLGAELATVGQHLRAGGAALEHEITRDWIAGHQAGKSFAQRWLRKAQGDSKSDAVATASAATEGSLHRIGVTESSEAFSSGRTFHLRLVSSHKLLRVWDAVLDSRTCPYCARADGTIVSLGQPFPLGEPGDVHPWCRCSWTLLHSLESADAMHIEPHEATQP